MKKILLAIMLLFATNIAIVNAGDIRILHPGNGTTENDKGNKPRNPVELIYFDQDETILTFDAFCIGCPITLLDEDETIVFSSIVDEDGTVELPCYLTGTFELQLVRGDITYAGEIEL